MSDSGSESAHGASPAAPAREIAQLELAEADVVINYIRRTVSVLLEDETGNNNI